MKRLFTFFKPTLLAVAALLLSGLSPVGCTCQDDESLPIDPVPPIEEPGEEPDDPIEVPDESVFVPPAGCQDTANFARKMRGFDPTYPHREGEIVVTHPFGLVPGILEALQKREGVNVEMSEFGPSALVRFQGDKNLLGELSLLACDPGVVYAEPNYLFGLNNDPRYDAVNQWGLENDGTRPLSTNGADIDAEAAWANSGSFVHPTVVAVIDTGVDAAHEDIDPTMLVDWLDLVGTEPSPKDEHGHGTRVVGILAATGNNGLGIRGVVWNKAWNVKVMPIRALKDGDFDLGRLKAAIEHAVEEDADIINASWGGPMHSAILHEAVCTTAKDVLFVTSAGNERVNIDSNPRYPASYSIDTIYNNSSVAKCPNNNVIVVTATDDQDRLSGSSNWGRKTVHLGAPGADLLAPLHGCTTCYRSFWGSSAAVPYVAGVAALRHAKTDESVSDLRKALRKGVDLVESLDRRTRWHGRVNAAEVLK